MRCCCWGLLLLWLLMNALSSLLPFARPAYGTLGCLLGLCYDSLLWKDTSKREEVFQMF